MSSQITLLFDLDGTLTDPKPGITKCIQYALEKLGIVVPETDQLLWCIGPPLKASFEQLLNSSDEQLINQAIALYRERFSTIGLFENTLYPEMLNVLQTLQAQNYRCFVATSKPHVFASRIIEHFALSRYFQHVYGSELDGTRSDKGELISYILTQEKLDPLHTLMIGDRKHDIIGAQKSGLACFGVLYGYGSRIELEEAKANLMFESPLALLTGIQHYFC
ncbi:MAG: HAD family hydrolase [Pseudomonadota bacterium]